MAAWVVPAALVITVMFLYVCMQRSRYRRLGSAIPGPAGLPLVGNIPTIARLGSSVMTYWTEQCTKFGSTWKLWLGPVLVVTITDPHDIHAVLNSDQTLSKPAPYKLFRLMMGRSLFVADCADWKRLRRIMEPAFNVQTLATFVKTFNKKSNILVQAIEKHAEGEAFDLEDYMMACALNTISETIFGAETCVGEEKKIISVKNFQKIKSSFYDLVMKPWFWCEYAVKITPTYKKFMDLAKPLLDYADVIIKHKKESKISTTIIEKCNENNFSENFKEYTCFLDSILDNFTGSSNVLTSQELKDQTIGLLVGGIDTIALTISIALMLLGHHRCVQKRVVKELEDIFGDDVHREASRKNLRQMVYLEQVIDETMRLFPVSPIVARQAQSDIILSNYVLPAGTTIVIPIFQVHRDPLHMSRPHEFDPDRFNTSTAERWRQLSFIPFTAGRRICIAKNYSYMLMKTTLSAILKNYEIIPCGSRSDMECVQFELTLKLVNGYKVKIKKREWKSASLEST